MNRSLRNVLIGCIAIILIFAGIVSFAAYEIRNRVIARLERNKPPYYVGTGSFIGIGRAILFVRDHNGTLAYQEVLPDEAETPAVLPVEADRDQVPIVGDNSIWRFRAP